MANEKDIDRTEDLIALKAWLRLNSEFSFLDEALNKFLTPITEKSTLCIDENYSNYDSQKSSNGGSYGFWTNLNYDSPGIYYISHHTTADFKYCMACGSFCGHDADACGYELIDLRTKKDKILIMERTEEHLLDELRRLRENIAIVAGGNK